jgi:hypothetical protein
MSQEFETPQEPSPPADDRHVDPIAVTEMIKAAADLVVAVEAFTELAKRLYPLLSRGASPRNGPSQPPR